MNSDIKCNNTVKILYKDFVKDYHHPKNKSYNIDIYARDIFEAYLTIVGEKYTLYNNSYFDTEKCRYILLTENNKNKFNTLFTYHKSLKKKFVIVLMLSAEFIDISLNESLRTVKFSNLFNNMTSDKLLKNGIDINWLSKNNFFK